MSLDALASGSAWQGAYADLGALFDRWHSLKCSVESGTAPTAGGIVSVYLVWSYDFTRFAGGVTGSDGSFTAANVSQLGIPYTLPALNSANAEQISNSWLIRPKARYVAPVLLNSWDQAIRNQATNSNNLSRIVLTPIIGSIED